MRKARPWRNVTGYRTITEPSGKLAIVNVLDCGHEITFGGGAEIIAKARVAERRRCYKCPEENAEPKKRKSVARSYLLDTDI